SLVFVLHYHALAPRSLHDALPICVDHLLQLERELAVGLRARLGGGLGPAQLLEARLRLREGRGERALLAKQAIGVLAEPGELGADRKSTRLNSSHVKISYAVFGLQ